MSDTGFTSRTAKKPRIFYGYVVVAACFLVMVVMHGAFNSFGVFFTPLENEFNCTRAVLSGANSVAFIVMGVSAMLLGMLSDKFSPRLILTFSGILFGIGYMLMSQVHAIGQIYFFLSLAGIGLSAADIIPLATVVRWFVRKRGTLSGIMKVGTGLGMMTVPFISSLLIETYGWSKSYLFLGIAVLVAVVPLSQLVRRNPREMGLLPDGDEKTADSSFSLTEEGLSLIEALKTKQLWMVCAFYMAIVYCGMTNLTHIVPYAEGLDIPKTTAASLVSTYGAVSMGGRLIMGFLGDRLGHKRAIIICLIIAVVGMSWLQAADELWMLYLFAAVYGFSHGGFFSLISPLIAGLFGTRSQGSLLGIVIFSGTLGGSIGMTLSGYIFDITGSYTIAFIILLGLVICGLVNMLLIKPIVKGTANDQAG
ncbi:MAG: MFS transporter [Dehalococcoidales bacterium]|nr:MAG: MFS transporter [Dehalococcoidales bacterium]